MKINIIIAVIVVLAMGGYWGYEKWSSSSLTKSTSQASGTKGNINIAYDSWLGYVPGVSEHMKKGLRNRGYNLVTTNDNADYADRFKKLAKGDYDMVFTALDGAILESDRYDFPGVVAFVVDVSRGGDKIVAWCDTVKDIDGLKTTGKVAFTPNSPSHHLVKSLSVHFGVSRFDKSFRNPWAVKTEGAQEAYKTLIKRDVEAAALWEPYASQALSDPKICEILGTQNTGDLIVDVLMVNRQFLANNPEAVKAYTRQYFTTLKHYLDPANAQDFYQEIKKENKSMKEEQIVKALAGIQFVNLTDNCKQWMGCNDEGESLVAAIDSTIDVLVKYEDFDSNPLPEENAYVLMNRTITEDVFGSGVGDSSVGASVDPLTKEFEPLPIEKWKTLQVVGTLQVDPIIFGNSSEELGLDAKTVIDNAVKNLKAYPNFRVKIEGHTSKKGDEQANMTLSKQRAQAVARYIEITYGVDSDRVLVEGFGGSKPLPKLNGEEMRAYNYRLPRVELVLVSERF